MPQFTVKEVRLPELHLPEIKREEIVRTLSGVRLPDVDLARAKRPTLRVPTVSVTADDLGRIVAVGEAIARLVRPASPRVRLPSNPFGRRSRSPVAMFARSRSRRSRRPLVLGILVVAAFAIVAFVRRPANRQRIEDAARNARERLAAWRAQDLRPDADVEDRTTTARTSDPVAPAVPTGDGDAAINDVATLDAPVDGVPAFEESPTPR